MVSGNFAGGFARGFQSSLGLASRVKSDREDRDLRRKAMEAKQQQMTRELAGKRIVGRNTEFTNLGVRLGSDPTFAASLTSNRVEDLPPGIQEMLAPHIQGQVKDVLMANPSLDPQAAQQQVEFSVMNSLLQSAAQTKQKVEQAGQIQAAQTAEQVRTLAPGQELVTGAGETVTERAAKPALVNLRNDQTGEEQTIDINDPNLPGLLQSGFNRISPSQVTGTREEVTGLPLTKSQRGKTAQEASQAAGTAAQISGVLQDIKEAGPGVVGFRAIAGKKLGGLVAQLSGSAGEAVTEAITGVSQEELGDIRTAARSAASALIRPLLQEQGARLSDQEREIADRTTGIVEDPTSSLPMVQGALKRALQLQYLVADRLALEAGQQGINLETDEGLNEFGSTLEDQGLPVEFIDQLIDELLLQRQTLGLVKG